MIRSISESENPIIVHAAGGVGKTIFCKHLITSIPEYSLTIAYDCFGTGSYRRQSTKYNNLLRIHARLLCFFQ